LTEDEIQTTLQALPQDLNETYLRILRKIQNKGSKAVEITQRILLWLVGATRPLHIYELYEAIMIDTQSNSLNEQYRLIDLMDIFQTCGSLIQGFTSSDFHEKDRLLEIQEILEDNDLKAVLLSQDNHLPYYQTFVRLSHYTVKVCILSYTGITEMLTMIF